MILQLFSAVAPERRMLLESLGRILAEREQEATLRILHCDTDEHGAFVRLAGLGRARDLLLADHLDSRPTSATLVIGLLPLPQLDAMPGMPWLGALEGWPGFAYLPYGFTKEEFLAVVQHVLEGTKTPLPEGLLPTVDDILRMTSEVRHWLQNRQKAVLIGLDDFEQAAEGGVALHQDYLKPVAPVSGEHRAMLDRLWALERAPAVFASRVGGLSAVREAVQAFETSWLALEVARTALRDADPGQHSAHLATEAAKRYRQVAADLTAAIQATLLLDAELTQRMKG